MNSVAKIGERIKTLREEKGFTQQTLADALHLKRETINMWENGFRDLKTGSIIALADFFDVSADYILGRTDNRTLDASIQSACEVTGLTEKAIMVLNKANQYKGDKRIPLNCVLEDGMDLDKNDGYAFLIFVDRLIRHKFTIDLVCDFADWVSAFSEAEGFEKMGESTADYISARMNDRDSTHQLKKRIIEATGDSSLSKRIVSNYDLFELFEYKSGEMFNQIINDIVCLSSNKAYIDTPREQAPALFY